MVKKHIRTHTISFQHAFDGIRSALTTQVNLKIHFSAALIAFLSAWYFRISYYELLVLILTISIVILAELANTSLEHLADAVTLKHNPHIKMAKDVAAGAVLFVSLVAVIIGIIIFGPKL